MGEDARFSESSATEAFPVLGNKWFSICLKATSFKIITS